MSSVRKIAIIGAGVCGATVAFRLQEQFGNSVSITIFSEEFSPNTTGTYNGEHRPLEMTEYLNKFINKFINSFTNLNNKKKYFVGDISAGLWSQYNLGDTPVERAS